VWASWHVRRRLFMAITLRAIARVIHALDT
jgi:hypothetical protein